jgi:Zn2+/Cd2+-exporting ATPase
MNIFNICKKPAAICLKFELLMTEILDLNITGMDCADCALTLEKGVGKLDGINACKVNFATAKMQLSGNINEEAVQKYIKSLGYDVADVGDRPQIISGWALAWDVIRRPRNAFALTGMVLVILAFLLGWWGVPEPIKIALLSMGGLVGMYYPARSGWAALRSGQGLDMNVLMTVAAVGAFAIGEYGEAATVIVLFSLGEALEGFTMQRARDSIRSLMLLAPPEATLLTACMDCEEHLGQPFPASEKPSFSDIQAQSSSAEPKSLAFTQTYEGGPCPWCGTHEQVLPVEALKVGDLILVKPGERIPMDGIIHSGHSAVDQAPITGESVPVEKQIGAEVFAGTVNGDGALEIEITHLAADNTLARLIHLVEEAQAQKTPVQRFVDRFARIYTPAVVITALLIATLPPLFFGQPFLDTPEAHGWLYRALAMLVIACPCALVIATPVTVVSAISVLARRGVLVKGGIYLENLGRIQVMAFDKTGTLTHGRPELTALACVDDCCHAAKAARQQNASFECVHCQEMLTLAAAVESRSTHPLAGAIIRAARSAVLPELNASQVENLPGRGIRGVVAGKQVIVGNHELFHTENGGIQVADCALFLAEPTSITGQDFCERVEAEEAAGQTVMIVGVDEQLLGYLAVSDPIRHTSRSALSALRREGIQQLLMLTGDNRAVAQTVGAELGVDDIRAGLLPGEKLQAVQGLMEDFEQVAMVGDGINDAPALAAASLGIAMGGAGAAQALETADIALMADDLSQLPAAIRLGRKALRIIRFNIWFALLIKAVFLVTAFMGVATLWMAVFADMGASLLVTLNGMRLLREK